jgi:hypothetical protein
MWPYILQILSCSKTRLHRDGLGIRFEYRWDKTGTILRETKVSQP